jgi:hypothetical protein
MLLPQILYDPTGTGVPITLSFTYPPVNKPLLDDREATRHDSFTSSGLRQSALERVDIIKNLQMENVPWSDLPAWATFIDYAIQGGEFSYYLDATQTAFQTFQLVDSNFKPSFSVRGLSKFTLVLRLVPLGAFSL